MDFIVCQVASVGAFLLNYNILTMSIAPRDIHEAQVQFALERGLPAMLGVLSTYKLPYPLRSFDMVHCSRCLVNWTAYGTCLSNYMHCVIGPFCLIHSASNNILSRWALLDGGGSCSTS